MEEQPDGTIIPVEPTPDSKWVRVEDRLPELESGTGKNPICGNCEKRKVDHYFESEIYCFENTTGDIFTDEPREDLITNMMVGLYPEIYTQLVSHWKKKSGHLTPQPPKQEK